MLPPPPAAALASHFPCELGMVQPLGDSDQVPGLAGGGSGKGKPDRRAEPGCAANGSEGRRTGNGWGPCCSPATG